eukprot:9698513-Heterocapsa_arctica.AAC.1
MRSRRALHAQVRHGLREQGLGRACLQDQGGGRERRDARQHLAADIPHALQVRAAAAGDGGAIRRAAAGPHLVPRRHPLRAHPRQHRREHQQARLQR